MTNVLRFHAPGPWLTRDLKECVLASDYDGMEAAWRDACERGDKAVAENAALRQRLRDWHRMADERSAEIVRLSTRLAEARANAFQDALDCMRDRQARDHLAACLQDKYGVWWKTDSANVRRCFKCGHAAHNDDCVNTAPDSATHRENDSHE